MNSQVILYSTSCILEDWVLEKMIGLAKERNGLYILDAKEDSNYSLSKSYLYSYSTNKRTLGSTIIVLIIQNLSAQDYVSIIIEKY